jgi:hypothetical protein
MVSIGLFLVGVVYGFRIIRLQIISRIERNRSERAGSVRTNVGYMCSTVIHGKLYNDPYRYISPNIVSFIVFVGAILWGRLTIKAAYLCVILFCLGKLKLDFCVLRRLYYCGFLG